MLICIWCINSKPPHDINSTWKNVPCTVMFLGGTGGGSLISNQCLLSQSILLEGNWIVKHLIFDSLEWRMWRQNDGKKLFRFLLYLNVQECMVHNQTIFNQININYFWFQLVPFNIPLQYLYHKLNRKKDHSTVNLWSKKLYKWLRILL